DAVLGADRPAPGVGGDPEPAGPEPDDHWRADPLAAAGDRTGLDLRKPIAQSSHRSSFHWKELPGGEGACNTAPPNLLPPARCRGLSLLFAALPRQFSGLSIGPQRGWLA